MNRAKGRTGNRLKITIKRIGSVALAFDFRSTCNGYRGLRILANRYCSNTAGCLTLETVRNGGANRTIISDHQLKPRTMTYCCAPFHVSHSTTVATVATSSQTAGTQLFAPGCLQMECPGRLHGILETRNGSPRYKFGARFGRAASRCPDRLSGTTQKSGWGQMVGYLLLVR